MAKQNVISNKSSTLTVDPGASGDSYVQFDINTTGKFRIGVDDDDSDKFKISLGSALGINDAFVFTADGVHVKPLQSSFGAYLSSTKSNVTGDLTYYSIIPDTVVWDNNSDYDNSTGRFTASASGIYLFTGGITLDDMTTAVRSAFYELVVSGHGDQRWGFFPYSAVGTGIFTNTCTLSATIVTAMDAADYCYTRIRCAGSTKTVDVYGGATDFKTFFSGCLIG